MRRRVTIALLALLAVAAAASGCGGDSGEGTDPAAADRGRFDAQRAFADLREQVELGPRPAGSAASRELTVRLAVKLRRAGVREVRIQRPQRNVTGVLPGRGEGYVVLGAHHDTKDDVGPGFQGANDGASGVAVVLELARTLPRPLPGPSVAVALFDGEEARGSRPFARDGMRGSRQYVRLARRSGQGTPPLAQIRAMVLFDMVGDCDLQVPRELNSDPGLYALFEQAAGGAPFGGVRGAIGDDHLPFLREGIPALDVIDFTFGPGGSPGEWWHTPEDTIDKVCPESLEAVGEAGRVAIPRIR
jgi:glutaminyl-peptide cyclotransferase